MIEDPWYAERRGHWRPDHIRLLLIAESAPDDGGDIANRRFFYDNDLTGRDGLFREVVRVLFDNPALNSAPQGKVPWLQKLRDRGVYLIDLASAPVNYSSPRDRTAALEENVRTVVALVTELRPDSVVLVKKNVFDLLQQPLLTAGLPLIHDQFIPFPGNGQQKRFRESFASALQGAAV